MSSSSLPDHLRKALEQDWQPVTPLSSPWRRSLLIGLVVSALACGALAVSGVNPQILHLAPWLSWGCTVFGLFLGISLASLALREAVPGEALPRRIIVAALGIGIGYHLLVGFLTWIHTAGSPVVGNGVEQGSGCFGHEILFALPAFAVTLWLVFRALPTRASVAGALGAAGAAIIADAITHMQCPVTDLRHVYIWHTGAIVLFIAVGYLVGKLWEARGERSFRG